MAKIKGICRNEECDHCDEIMEAEKSNFVCEYCQKPLFPISAKTGGDPSKINPKLIGLIVGALAVLCGLGVGAYFLFFNKGITDIKLEKDSIELTVGEKDLLKPAAVPEGAEATFTFKTGSDCITVTQGGEVTAVKPGEGTITIKCKENKEARATCTVKVKAPETPQVNEGAEEAKQAEEAEKAKQAEEEAKAKEAEEEARKAEEGKKQQKSTQTSAGTSTNARYGTVNLGYGTYTGDLKNGKPHGHGTITYRSSHTITGSYVASPGDKYEGDFRDGRVSGGLGYWTHNGNMKTINP
jgi:hypothetical protein